MAREKLGRNASSAFLIVDAQSVKNTDTAALKGYDAGKKVSGIERHIAVDTQGLPHAIAVTMAEVTNRKGALQALQRCKPALSRVHALLCDSGYVGKPFAQGVQDILGEHVSVQIAKRSELHRFKVMPSAGWWSAALSGWRRTGGCGRTARGCLTPACSSSIWHF